MEVPMDRPACGGCEYLDENLRCERLMAGLPCLYAKKEDGEDDE